MTTIRFPVPRAMSASGIYFAAHVSLLLAGLISMPIMTRLLSQSQYGILSVVFTTASVLALIAGMGCGEAALRLHGEYRRRGPQALRELAESLLTGVFVASALVVLGAAAVVLLAPAAARSAYADCLVLIGVLIVVRALSSVVFQIQRAEERALAYASTQVAMRYATTVVAVSALLLWTRQAYVIVAAALAVETAGLAIRLVDLRRRGLVRRPRLSPAVLAALSYGLPLAAAGWARYVLDYGDRLLIERFLGLEAVATYTVSYDLANRFSGAIVLPAQLAVVPMLFRLWTDEGQEAASRLASQVLTYVIALTIPAAALYLIYNRDIIVLLASGKYAASAALTPYLLPGVLLGGMNFIVVVGLTVQKRTMRLALGVGAAAVLNLVLNLLLIPVWHLAGAAVATTAAYAALLAGNYAVSRSAIQLRVDGVVVAKAAVATAAAVALLVSTDRVPSTGAWNLAASLVGGGATALGLFTALDPTLRRWVRPAPDAERNARRAVVD